MHFSVSCWQKFPMGLSGAAVTKPWFTRPLLLPQCKSTKSNTSCVCLLGTGNSLDFEIKDLQSSLIKVWGDAGPLDKAASLSMARGKKKCLFQHAGKWEGGEFMCGYGLKLTAALAPVSRKEEGLRCLEKSKREEFPKQPRPFSYRVRTAGLPVDGRKN